MGLRIALLGIYHESNTFIDSTTTMADFENGHLLLGEAIRTEYVNAFHEIGGMLEVMSDEDIEVVPVFYAEATPGGVITADAYNTLTERMFDALDNVGSIDACLVSVHGAAVSEQAKDMDGDWLSRLRDKVGAEMPIVGTLDLHANVSQKMVDATNVLVSYRENPHLDQRERGKDAALILVKILKEDAKVFQHLIQVPVAISIEQQFTQEEPCLRLYAQADFLQNTEGVLSVSVALGFPYADVAEMGTSIIVVVEDQEVLAVQIAKKLEKYIWQNRSLFVGEKSSEEEAIEKVNTLETPVLFLDMGDNIGGGSPGNGLSLVKILEQKGAYRYFCYFHAPGVVWSLENKGTGSVFTVDLKGFDAHGEAAVRLEAKLLKWGAGEFTEDTPRHGGQVNYNMGKIAVVQTSGGGTLLLSTLRVPPFSLKQITSFGIDPSKFDVLIAKGVNAPIAAYGPVCKSIVQVNTPGVTQAEMTKFSYQNRRVPLFPFETTIEVKQVEVPPHLIKKVPFYTEGPAVDAAGNLFFTNLMGKSVFQLDKAGEEREWTKLICPNGQTIDADNNHLICDSVASAVVKLDANGQFVANIVNKHCAGYPVYSPNDVVVDVYGGIYFTDSVRNTGKVFYVAPDGTETCLASEIDYPNGLALSPNENALYVAESYANRILRFNLNPFTKIWDKEVFAVLPTHSSGRAIDNLPDGIAFDSKGNLWVAHYGMGAVQVLNHLGELVATLSVGFPLVSNLCFTSNEKEVLITGGFGEPGPGAVLLYSLEDVNQLLV